MGRVTGFCLCFATLTGEAVIIQLEDMTHEKVEKTGCHCAIYLSLQMYDNSLNYQHHYLPSFTISFNLLS